MIASKRRLKEASSQRQCATVKLFLPFLISSVALPLAFRASLSFHVPPVLLSLLHVGAGKGNWGVAGEAQTHATAVLDKGDPNAEDKLTK